MKRFVAAITIFAAFATSSAFAADVRRPVYVPPLVFQQPPPLQYVVKANTWAGFYAGGEFGKSHGSIDFNNIDPKISGKEYGAFAGYNFQHGHLVFGPEVSFDKVNERGFNWLEYCDNLGNTYDVYTKVGLNSLTAVTGRVGLAFGPEDRFLVYAKAGVGWATGQGHLLNIGSYGNASWVADEAAASFKSFGTVLGVGLDVKVGKHGFIGVEASSFNPKSVNLLTDYEKYPNNTRVGLGRDNRVMIRAGINF